jgi:hypothetical protein
VVHFGVFQALLRLHGADMDALKRLGAYVASLTVDAALGNAAAAATLNAALLMLLAMLPVVTSVHGVAAVPAAHAVDDVGDWRADVAAAVSMQRDGADLRTTVKRQGCAMS